MSTLADLDASIDVYYEGQDAYTTMNDQGGKFTLFVPKWSLLRPTLKIIEGLPEIVKYPNGSVGKRIVPLTMSFPRSMLVRVSWRGGGKCSQAVGSKSREPVWDFAWIDVEMGQPGFSADSAYPMVEAHFAPGMEFVTRPGSAYTFPSDGLRLTQPVGVPIPTMDFSLTFHNLPRLNLQLRRRLAGKVNATPFFAGYEQDFLGFPTGTVQYVAPTVDASYDSNGQSRYTVTDNFKYRYVPHNMIMRPDGRGFEAPVQLAGTGADVIPIDAQTALSIFIGEFPTEYIIPVGELNQLFY